MADSKTGKKAALAAAAAAAKAKKVVPDDVLLKQYREERAQGLWPSLDKSDAVLREYDRVAALVPAPVAS